MAVLKQSCSSLSYFTSCQLSMVAGRRGPSLPPGLLPADMPHARLRAPALAQLPVVGERLAVDHRHRLKPTAVSGHIRPGCVLAWACCLRTACF